MTPRRLRPPRSAERLLGLLLPWQYRDEHLGDLEEGFLRVNDLAAEVHSSAGLNLDEIVTLMADHWRQGKKVVRLHTGDPAIFGAIKEQMVKLTAQEIPYSVVPGVSSVFAAAAAL